ncbi:hypothetical protein LINPERPRIM_LOCUS39717 [Linum perenne]
MVIIFQNNDFDLKLATNDNGGEDGLSRQQPLLPQLGLGSCLCGTIETCLLYRNCSIRRNTSYPIQSSPE